jgi:hypothetical protein
MANFIDTDKNGTIGMWSRIYLQFIFMPPINEFALRINLAEDIESHVSLS